MTLTAFAPVAMVARLVSLSYVLQPLSQWASHKHPPQLYLCQLQGLPPTVQGQAS